MQARVCRFSVLCSSTRDFLKKSSAFFFYFGLLTTLLEVHKGVKVGFFSQWYSHYTLIRRRVLFFKTVEIGTSLTGFPGSREGSPEEPRFAPSYSLRMFFLSSVR